MVQVLLQRYTFAINDQQFNDVIIFQKEIVQIHVGQAGVQIGSACWELFNLEHAVQPNGMLAHEYIKPMSINAESVNNIETFYYMTDSSREARCQPRCVMVDLEPSVIGTNQLMNWSIFCSKPNYFRRN